MRLLRSVVLLLAVMGIILGARDASALGGSCHACVTGCASGLLAACRDQCGETYFPDGCYASSICEENGGHYVACYTID